MLKWANKKCKNFNIYNVVFFKKKNREKHLEISLFYTFVPKILMIWSTVLRDTGCDRLKLIVMGHFLTRPPLSPRPP